MIKPEDIPVQAVDAAWRLIETDGGEDVSSSLVRAAIAAALNAWEGYVMVPVEPTAEMNAAGYMYQLKMKAEVPAWTAKRNSHEVYAAMLAARPNGRASPAPQEPSCASPTAAG